MTESLEESETSESSDILPYRGSSLKECLVQTLVKLKSRVTSDLYSHQLILPSF